MPDDITDQIASRGIPILPAECIGDSLIKINSSFEYLALQADLTNETLALTGKNAQTQLNRHETRINELSAPLQGDIISTPWTTQTKYLSTKYNNIVPSNKGGAGSEIGLLSANGLGFVVGLGSTPNTFTSGSSPTRGAIVTYGFFNDLVTSVYTPLTSHNKEVTDRILGDNTLNTDLTNLANTKIQIPTNSHWPTGNVNTPGYVLTYDPTSSKTADKWVPKPPASPIAMTGAIVCDSNFVTSYSNVVPSNKGGAGNTTGILSANGSGFVSPATPSVDYVIPSDLSPYAKIIALDSYLTKIEAQETYNPITEHQRVKVSWIKNPLINEATKSLYTNQQFASGGITYGVPGQLSDALQNNNVLTLADTLVDGHSIKTWVSRPPAAPTLTGAISSIGGYSVDNPQSRFVTSYAQVVPSDKGGAGSINGLLKADGNGVVSKALEPTDYLVRESVPRFANYLPISSLKINPDARNNSLIKYDDYQKTWRIASPEDEPFAEVNFIYGLAKQQAGWYSGCAYSERRVIVWGQIDGKGQDSHFKFSKTNSDNFVQVPHNYTYIPFHSEYNTNGNTGNNIHFFDLDVNKKAYIKDLYWNWSCGMAWVRNEDHGKIATGTNNTLTDWSNGPIGAEDTVWVIGNHRSKVPRFKELIPANAFTANQTALFTAVKYQKFNKTPTTSGRLVRIVVRPIASNLNVIKALGVNSFLQVENVSTRPSSGETIDISETKPQTGVRIIHSITPSNPNDRTTSADVTIEYIDTEAPTYTDANTQYTEGLMSVRFGGFPSQIKQGTFAVIPGATDVIVTITNHGITSNEDFIIDSLIFDNYQDYENKTRLFAVPLTKPKSGTISPNTFTYVDASNNIYKPNQAFSGKIIIRAPGIANSSIGYTATDKVIKNLRTQIQKYGYALNDFEYRINNKEEYITDQTGSIGIPGNGGGANKQTCGFVPVKLPGFPRTQLVNRPGHPLHGKYIKEEIVKIQCNTDPGVPNNFTPDNLLKSKNNANLPADDPLKVRAELMTKALTGKDVSANNFSNFNLWGVLTNFGNLYVWGRSRDGCFGLGLKSDTTVDLQINSPTLVSEIQTANDIVNTRNFAGSIVDFEFTSAEFDATTLGVITLSGNDEDWPDRFMTGSATVPHQALFFAGDNSNFQLGAGTRVTKQEAALGGGGEGQFWPASMDFFVRSQKIVETLGSNQYGLCTPSQLAANAALQPTYINNAKTIVRSLYGGRQANGYIDMDGRLWMCGSNSNGVLGNCGYLSKVNPHKFTDRGIKEAGHYAYGSGFVMRSILVKNSTRLTSGSYGRQGSETVTQIYDRVPQYVQEYPFRITNYPAGDIKAALASTLQENTDFNSLIGVQYKGRGYFCESKIRTWQDDALVGTQSNNLQYNIVDACAVYNRKNPGSVDAWGEPELIKIDSEEQLSTHYGSTYVDESAAQGGNGAYTVTLANRRPRPKFVDAYIAGMNCPYLLVLAEEDSGNVPKQNKQFNLYACGQNGVVTLNQNKDQTTGNGNAWKTNHGYLGIDSEGLIIPRLMPCVYKKEVKKDNSDSQDLGKIIKDKVRNAVKIYCSDTNGSRNIEHSSQKIVNVQTFEFKRNVGSSSSRRTITWNEYFTTTTELKWATASYANLGASGYIDTENLAYIAGFNTFNDPPDYDSISYQYFTRLPINNVDDLVLGGDLEAHKYQFFRTKSGIVWGQGEGASNVLGLQNDCYVPIRII